MADANRVRKLEFVSGLMTIGHSLAQFMMTNPEALSLYVKFMEENSDTFDVMDDSDDGMSVEDTVKKDMRHASKAFLSIYESSERQLTIETLGEVFGMWLLTGETD